MKHKVLKKDEGGQGRQFTNEELKAINVKNKFSLREAPELGLAQLALT